MGYVCVYILGYEAMLLVNIITTVECMNKLEE